MSDVIIRSATDEDGLAIGALFAEAKYDDHGAKWDQPGLGSWWLVAEREGRLIGAVQIMASRPIAWIGEIVVHPDERARRSDGIGGLHKRVGALAWDLYVMALSTLKGHGCDAVQGIVSEDSEPLQHILKRYGAVDLGRFHLLARRL